MYGCLGVLCAWMAGSGRSLLSCREGRKGRWSRVGVGVGALKVELPTCESVVGDVNCGNISVKSECLAG